jgi:hypothetical protein
MTISTLNLFQELVQLSASRQVEFVCGLGTASDWSRSFAIYVLVKSTGELSRPDLSKIAVLFATQTRLPRWPRLKSLPDYLGYLDFCRRRLLSLSDLILELYGQQLQSGYHQAAEKGFREKLTLLRAGSIAPINTRVTWQQHSRLMVNAILAGRPIETEVLGLNYFAKALYTAVSPHSGRVLDYSATRGYRLKRQDGKNPTGEQAEQIEAGLRRIEQVTGSLRTHLSTGLLFIHTNGTRPFQSGANQHWLINGVYRPALKSITVGYRSVKGEEQFALTALSHEIAHWLNDLQVLTLSVEFLSTAQQQMNSVAHLSKAKQTYYQRPAELLARLFEQFVAVSLGEGEAGMACTLPVGEYWAGPGYWSRSAWELLQAELQLQVAKLSASR